MRGEDILRLFSNSALKSIISVSLIFMYVRKKVIVCHSLQSNKIEFMTKLFISCRCKSVILILNRETA